MKTNVLVVDDDNHMRIALKESLARAGYSVSVAEDGKEALDEIERRIFDLVITDVKMPHVSGIDLLNHIKESRPFMPVILMTGYGTVQDAVKVIKEGAYDYIQKPFNTDTLYGIVKRALGVKNGKIVYASRVMKDILLKAERVAKSDATVLVLGESGVGKEVISRYIHENSDRHDKSFVAVNCAALPETLLESELFGYEKGAFTGAFARKLGKFELADKGTILLDEVTEMDPRLQAKLLRVLQEKEIEVIGSKYPKQVNVRVIATTNRNINKYVSEGKFREDLYYRLNVFPITVPPLRERKEDIPPLVEYLLKKHAKGMDVGIDSEAISYLKERPWRGNVRELENLIARACILSNSSVIKLTHLTDIDCASESVAGSGSVKDMETKLILDALKSVKGNRTKAALILGITVRTLRNKIHEYKTMGIEVPVKEY
ncbi:MAG: sigma-54-dependent Fis family transcriptional regulator [Syntrophus sp. (in: bacteria)]|nr:sigma-54-dependent Fis family transcriptional regulator [Syntrophus sp. (in: bacteria)]